MAEGTRPTLTVEERSERGTRATKRLRREGLVPGVVYGGTDGESHAFKVGVRDLRQALVDGSALIDLELGSGKSRPVIVKDQQLHPVRGDVMHIDLLEVDLKQTIQSQVAIHVEGAEDAPGVREGGVLEQVTHQVTIEALPTAIPDFITVDVSGLEVAATLALSEVQAPEGVTFLDDLEETVIATVVVPTEVEEPEQIEQETELVGEAGAEAAGGDGEQAADGSSSDE
jgi:large subunit ribosomal protein L25